MRHTSPLTAHYVSVGLVMGLVGLLMLAAQFHWLRRGGPGNGRKARMRGNANGGPRDSPRRAPGPACAGAV